MTSATTRGMPYRWPSRWTTATDTPRAMAAAVAVAIAVVAPGPYSCSVWLKAVAIAVAMAKPGLSLEPGRTEETFYSCTIVRIQTHPKPANEVKSFCRCLHGLSKPFPTSPQDKSKPTSKNALTSTGGSGGFCLNDVANPAWQDYQAGKNKNNY